MQNKQIQQTRIPRPKGATNLARSGLFKPLQDLIISKYIQGNFPYPGIFVSMVTLAELYQVPLKPLQSAIQSGLQENLIGEGVDAVKALEKARSQALSNTLSRIGESDLLLRSILHKLSNLVLVSRSPHPLYVKELNSSISTQIKLTETQLKAIAQIQSFLDAIPQDGNLDEPILSREEALEILSNQELDLTALEAYTQGTPNLRPNAAEDGTPRLTYNRDASHEALKGEGIKELPIIPEIPILPK